MKDITGQKLERVRGYMEANGYTGMILMRKDNFAWLTTGGNSCVIGPASEGMGALVILPDKAYICLLYTSQITPMCKNFW